MNIPKMKIGNPKGPKKAQIIAHRNTYRKSLMRLPPSVAVSIYSRIALQVMIVVKRSGKSSKREE
jgi:hypothetical protein